MNRLHVYTVHIDPASLQPYEEARFVKEGFNFWAFVFTGFWALYNRLWLHALMIFAVNGLILFMAMTPKNHISVSVIELGWHLIIGYLANDFLRTQFRKRGFVTADIVTGDSLIRAEQRFFDRYFASRNNAPAFV